MIVYQVINCLISLPKHMLRVLKRTVAMRRFFYARNYRLNLMIKKIFRKISSKSVFIYALIYTVCRYDTAQ